jgi:translation initiation factor IF-2
LQAPTDSAAYVAAPQHQHQPPPPATRHSPEGAAPRHGEGGQSRRRTAAPRHTAGCGPRPGPAPAADRPAATAPHDTSPVNNNRPEEMRTSCRQQPAPPQHNAAKMSPRISIGPEPVLAAHAPSQPAAGSHCLAREGSVRDSCKHMSTQAMSCWFHTL